MIGPATRPSASAYTPGQIVNLTITSANGANVAPTGGTLAAGYAVANGNGQITQVTMTNIGSGYAPGTTSISFPRRPRPAAALRQKPASRAERFRHRFVDPRQRRRQ